MLPRSLSSLSLSLSLFSFLISLSLSLPDLLPFSLSLFPISLLLPLPRQSSPSLSPSTSLSRFSRSFSLAILLPFSQEAKNKYPRNMEDNDQPTLYTCREKLHRKLKIQSSALPQWRHLTTAAAAPLRRMTSKSEEVQGVARATITDFFLSSSLQLPE